MRTAAPPSPLPRDTEVLELLLGNAELLFWISLILAVAFVGMLAAALVVIWRSGTLGPPVVAVTLVLGVLALGCLVTLVLRPDLEALVAVVGTAVGGLSGAVAVAFERSSRDDDDDDDDGG